MFGAEGALSWYNAIVAHAVTGTTVVPGRLQATGAPLIKWLKALSAAHKN